MLLQEGTLLGTDIDLSLPKKSLIWMRNVSEEAVEQCWDLLFPKARLHPSQGTKVLGFHMG
jgi:hypothetical protein